MRDALGLELTTASAAAVTAIDALVPAFLAHGRSAPTHLAAALTADPDLALGHAAKAMFSVLLARAELRQVARDAAAAAELSIALHGGTDRERLHVKAARLAADGDWLGAIAQLEAVIARYPADSLAAKLSHAFRFMLGDKAGLLQSIDRVVAATATDHPHRGYLLGCRAFALEENGSYAEAEFIGRTGVDLAPDDAWGTHAVSHVHEMAGRAVDGATWIAARRHRFAHCNNFRYHLFWHLALFHLDMGRIDDALHLYDEEIRADRTDDFRDIANGASLLARLELSGADVGNRWEELAGFAEKRVHDGSLVFADLHYLLALVGAGRTNAAETLARALMAGDVGNDAQKSVARQVGGKVASGLLAYFDGRFEEGARTLMGVRSDIIRIGGSDAQRDVFEQIFLDCLVKARFDDAAETFLISRIRRRGGGNRFAAERLAQLKRHHGGEGGRIGVLAMAAMAPSIE